MFVSPALQRGESRFQRLTSESRRDGARTFLVQESIARTSRTQKSAGFTVCRKTRWRRSNESGRDFSRADNANKMDWTLQLAEKLIRGEFCNKGTALAGPQMQQNKGRALAPAGLSSESSPSFRGFSAACLAPEGPFQSRQKPAWSFAPRDLFHVQNRVDSISRAVGAAFVSPALQRGGSIHLDIISPVGTALAWEQPSPCCHPMQCTSPSCNRIASGPRIPLGLKAKLPRGRLLGSRSPQEPQKR